MFSPVVVLFLGAFFASQKTGLLRQPQVARVPRYRAPAPALRAVAA
jgi:hypothetical protein